VSVVEKTYTYGSGRSWVKREYTASEAYNVEKFVDLNYRNIWLIKKGKQ
jgi:hypothetical protein